MRSAFEASGALGRANSAAVAAPAQPPCPIQLVCTGHNWLLQHNVYDTSRTAAELLRTVRYTYYKTGHASNITIKDQYIDPQTTPGDPDDYDWHHDLALYYDMGHKLRIGLWDRWKDEDGNGQADPGTYEHSAAREFRYDPLLGPRARYAAVDYDTGDEHEPNAWTITEPIGWTDYDSLLPYQDLELTADGQGGYDVTAVRRYLGTAADEPLDANGQPLDTRYYHQDLIGSTWLLSDSGGTAVSAVKYTAFGEILDETGVPGASAPEDFPRYQYAGRWGYESGLLALQGVNPNFAPIILQHVGHRWYEPDIGRFVQRDPIGRAGGPNLYAYVGGNPANAVDPTGLDRCVVWDGPHKYILVWDPIEKRWKRIDFMGKGGVKLWGPGQVLVGGLAPGPRGRRIRSSAAEDLALLDAARYMQRYGAPDYNIFWSNCIQFTNALDNFPGDLNPPAPPKRERPRHNPCPIPSGWVCFARGTPVWTNGGYLRIEEVGQSSPVSSLESPNGPVRTGRVRAAGITDRVQELVEVKLTGEKIRSTPDQPYFTAKRGWVAARNLSPGERLVTIKGTAVVVEGVERIRCCEAVPVYDVETQNGTFFVGRAGVLVHSVCSRAVRQHNPGER